MSDNTIKFYLGNQSNFENDFNIKVSGYENDKQLLEPFKTIIWNADKHPNIILDNGSTIFTALTRKNKDNNSDASLKLKLSF